MNFSASSSTTSSSSSPISPSPAPQRSRPGLRLRLTDWLETHWVNPDYQGWLLGALSLFFFFAASNTMAGWLYVMSGVTLALLAIAIYLTRRSLRNLTAQRGPTTAVSVGQPLHLELTLRNPEAQAKSLLQLQDPLPSGLGAPEQTAIALIGPRQDYTHRYQRLAQARGIYRWDQVTIRSAAPLGLFWYRRSLPLKTTAIVYPPVLPLERCPLVDAQGQEQNPNWQQIQRSQPANEGLTRALRPYRWGDPIRMVHWRTSARYGELRVRELETLQAGQEIWLALDSASAWQALPHLDLSVAPGQINSFEQAVIALASLYRYASRHHGQVHLWTAASGWVQSKGQGSFQAERPILETLATVQPNETISSKNTSPQAPTSAPFQHPILWLTQNPTSLSQLPPGSRWLLWPQAEAAQRPPTPCPGLFLDPQIPLQAQLQRPPSP